MGFMSPELPDVDRSTWPTLPRATRLQVVTRHWAEHGFGTPYAVYLLYLLKIALYVAAPAAIISLTPGLGGLGRIGDWWTQPIVYQKVVIFTLLFEVTGLGCGSGPLTGRFMPPIGGILYWLRPNTIRLPAWPGKVPFTRGDVRVIVLEGQPIHVQRQSYRILDAKTGLIEAGYVDVKDMLTRQPWPEPGDDCPVHVIDDAHG